MTPAVNPGMCEWEMSSGDPKLARIDRLWVFWRKAGPPEAGVGQGTIFYKTYRVGVDLTELGMPPIPMNPGGTPAVTVDVTNNFGPYEIDPTGRVIYFSEVDERYGSLFQPDTMPWIGFDNGAPDPNPLNPITISYKDADDDDQEVEAYDVFWLEELPEQSLFGFAADSNVNEGSIYAFADPSGVVPGTLDGFTSSKIWVFWTSTRAGTSDLFWETLSPNFAAR